MARWLKVLSAFVDRDEWGIRELAGAIDLPRSAVHRILHEMAGLDLLTPAGVRGHFRLGPELARLAVLLADHLDVRRVARPILEAMGQRITLCGPVGSGQTVKLCNQIAVCLNNLAMAEALVFCQQSGVDPAVMIEAVSAGAAGSWQISNLGPKVVARDFAPGFKVALQQKDLRLALEAADALHVPLAGVSLVHQLFGAVEGRYGGDTGTQALVRALEALTGIEVGTGGRAAG